MANKQHYARQGQQMAASFSALADDISSLQAIYFDRGYNAGAADALTDADVEALGITAADVTGMITFAGALETFMAANRGYLSKMRNDL